MVGGSGGNRQRVARGEQKERCRKKNKNKNKINNNNKRYGWTELRKKNSPLPPPLPLTGIVPGQQQQQQQMKQYFLFLENIDIPYESDQQTSNPFPFGNGRLAEIRRAYIVTWAVVVVVVGDDERNISRQLESHVAAIFIICGFWRENAHSSEPGRAGLCHSSYRTMDKMRCSTGNRSRVVRIV